MRTQPPPGFCPLPASLLSPSPESSSFQRNQGDLSRTAGAVSPPRAPRLNSEIGDSPWSRSGRSGNTNRSEVKVGSWLLTPYAVYFEQNTPEKFYLVSKVCVPTIVIIIPEGGKNSLGIQLGPYLAKDFSDGFCFLGLQNLFNPVKTWGQGQESLW